MAREPHQKGGVGGWLVLAGLVVFGGLMKVTMELGPVAIPIWFMTIAGTAFVMRGPVGQAIARSISGEVPTEQLPAELPEELYAELDEMRARLAELEERQDFSERLLARREEPPAAG
jgi:hypothetical protein